MSNVRPAPNTTQHQQSGGKGYASTSLNIGVVAAIAAAACLLLLAAVLYIRHVMRRFDEIVARNIRPPKARLESAAVDALPSFPYHQRTSSDGGAPTQCTVCLSLMRDGEMVKLLPDCEHVFHVRCIDTWLQACATCPVCRTVVKPSGEAVAINTPPPAPPAATAASPPPLPPV